MSDKGAACRQDRVLIRPSYIWLPAPVFLAAKSATLILSVIGGWASPVPSQRLVALNVIGMLVFTTVVWLEICCVKVKITGFGVESRDLLGRRHWVAWEEIQSVENFRGIRRRFWGIRIASLRDTVTIHEHVFLERAVQLADIMKSRVPRAIWPLPVSVQRRPGHQAVPGE